MPIYLVIYFERDIMPLSIVTRFHKDLAKSVCLTERTSLIWWDYWQFKGYNPGVPWTFELVVELWLDMIHLGIVTRFQEDIIKIVWLRERKSLANPPQVFKEDIPFFKQASKNVLCIQWNDKKKVVTNWDFTDTPMFGK